MARQCIARGEALTRQCIAREAAQEAEGYEFLERTTPLKGSEQEVSFEVWPMQYKR